MDMCVPSWDLDDNTVTARHSFRFNFNFASSDVPMLDKEVAELTWENGQLAMHNLLPKPLNSTTWDKSRASGTLESIVNQATCLPFCKDSIDGGADELVPLLDLDHHLGAASSATMTVDALVPCLNKSKDRTMHVMESMPGLGGTCVVGSSTRVGSCCGTVNTQEDEVVLLAGKHARVAAE
ncbi:hypothetical protein V6N13_045642 [Hibiscus sabdariffa]|uniref:Uncharacterized protein n=1 Tax=Hibiscus sabdariffa TaxID=183260 RepID=A0ABR2RM22_9ROSI